MPIENCHIVIKLNEQPLLMKVETWFDEDVFPGALGVEGV